MKNFKFNTIYIIESLGVDEPKTGRILYDDLQVQQYVHQGLQVKFNDINNAFEWDDLMSHILNKCMTNREFPILHLEIHGCKQGIEFRDGSFRTVEQVGEQFRKINIATGCNLFITMGVCKGLYVLFETHIDKPMPFCGAIGSFEKMSSYDIQLRYAEFYGTFFKTFDVTQAYLQLIKTDTGTPNEYTQYRYIRVDEVFYKAYLDYIKKACTQEGMNQRALDAAKENGVVLQTRQIRRKFQRDFAKEEKKSRGFYYKQAAKQFFMLDSYPENKDRFEVPDSYENLEQRCKDIITT